MKKKHIVIIALILVGYLVLHYKYPSGTWNYRMTVEIETPEGVKSGSAVRQVNQYSRYNSFWIYGYFGQPIGGLMAMADAAIWLLLTKPKFVGEAVVIDLGERGVVFALVHHDSDYELYSAFPNKKNAITIEGIRYYNKVLVAGTKAELKTNQPKMVTFTDMNDPKSVKLVKGGRFNVKTQKHDPVDDFEELFGQGVKLKSITIEITDAPVTQGVVDKWLPWIETVKKGSLDGRMGTFSNDLSSILHYGNFKTGSK